MGGVVNAIGRGISGAIGGVTGALVGDPKRDIDPSLFQLPQGVGLTEGQQSQFDQQLQAQQGLMGQQQAFLDTLDQQRRGEGPSVARELLGQGTQQALQSQLALAQQGQSPLAGRVAAQQSGTLQQQAAGQAALLGQQEQLQATQAMQQQFGLLQQQQAQQQQLVQFFESLGFSREQAQFEASQRMGGLQVEAGIRDQQARAGLISGIFGGLQKIAGAGG